MTTSLATLLIQETKTAIYTAALDIATSLGLPVTSWQAGDPTRSLFHVESEFLSKLEDIVVNFIKSGFLDYATGDWLKVVAKQVFNVDVPAATYATADVVLTNSGGGVYDLEAGDLTLKNTTSGKTYRNTTGGHLEAGPSTLTITVVADEAGSDSSAGIGEIDDLVTGLLGVTCSNALAAVGNDEQDTSVTILQCRDKLGALSPNGPATAYSYVARNPELTGTNAVTRVRVYADSDTGDVTVLLAGPSGGVSPTDLALVETAIGTYATPLCITASVLAATNATISVTYAMWVYKSVNKTAAEIEAEVETALVDMLATRPIGGDIIPPGTTGSLFVSMIESTIRSLYPQVFRVIVSVPSGDIGLANDEVAVLGSAPTATINLVVDP